MNMTRTCVHKHGLDHRRMMNQDDTTHVQQPCADDNSCLMGQAASVMPWQSKYIRQACRTTSKMHLASDTAAVSLQEQDWQIEHRACHVLNFRLRPECPPNGKKLCMSDSLEISSVGSCLGPRYLVHSGTADPHQICLGNRFCHTISALSSKLLQLIGSMPGTPLL